MSFSALRSGSTERYSKSFCKTINIELRSLHHTSKETHLRTTMAYTRVKRVSLVVIGFIITLLVILHSESYSSLRSGICLNNGWECNTMNYLLQKYHSSLACAEYLRYKTLCVFLKANYRQQKCLSLPNYSIMGESRIISHLKNALKIIFRCSGPFQAYTASLCL